MSIHLRPAATLSGDGSSTARRWWALGVLCCSLLMVNLDNTVLNVALPTLVRDLRATTSQLQWIVDAYVLVYASLLLVAGSIADRVGRKNTFLLGLAAFAAGSAWAAHCATVDTLIAARAGMGIGAAMMMPSTLSIITDLFRDDGERRRAIGLWAATSGLGIAIGPVVGGALLAHFWWGSVFLINVPIAAMAILCALPLVPNSRNAGGARIDIAGAVLSVVGLGLLLWSIIEAPVKGWTSTPVLLVGAGAAVVLVTFGWTEHRSGHPMLNLAFFRNRNFSAAVGSLSMVTFGLYATLFVMTQFLQFSLGYTALQTGLRTLPAAGAVALIAPMSATLVGRLGTRVVVVFGLAVTAGGLWQMSLATPQSGYGQVVAGMVMLGAGAGLALPAATSSVLATLPQSDTGVGSATNGAFMQVGGALGVAVIGSLTSTRYQNRMSGTLAPMHLPRWITDIIDGSLGGALTVAQHAGGAVGVQLGRLARSAYVDGMDLGLRTAAVVAAVGALVALLGLDSTGQQTRSHPTRLAEHGDTTSGR